MAFGVVHMGRRGQCAILAGRSQFVCRCCSGSGWLPFPSIMIRRLGCINAILLGGVAFGVVHLWLSWACCHRCKSQSPGAQCCCPVIWLRFVCALVRLTDSIAPDHYMGGGGAARDLRPARGALFRSPWSMEHGAVRDSRFGCVGHQHQLPCKAQGCAQWQGV